MRVPIFGFMKRKQPNDLSISVSCRYEHCIVWRSIKLSIHFTYGYNSKDIVHHHEHTSSWLVVVSNSNAKQPKQRLTTESEHKQKQAKGTKKCTTAPTTTTAKLCFMAGVIKLNWNITENNGPQKKVSLSVFVGILLLLPFSLCQFHLLTVWRAH